MRFGFWASSGGSWSEILERSVAAERSGWDGVWVPDHFMLPAGGYNDKAADDSELAPVHEAWSLLAGLAAVVPRVRLGPMVSGNTYRHPAVLAKQAATVDHISGGRVVVGIGAGWQQNEHERYGLTYGTAGERADKLDEACAMLRGLFADDRTDHGGEHYQLAGAPLSPKPVQRPIPIMIGGGGERRTLRTAARFADEWNVWGTPEVLTHKQEVLDRHCADIDRDPSEIQRSAAALLLLVDDEAQAQSLRDRPSDRPRLIGTPAQLVEQVAVYEAAGVDELVIPDFTFRPEQAVETIERFAAEVIAEVRT